MKKYILIMAGLIAAVSCARSGEGVNEPVKSAEFVISDFKSGDAFGTRTEFSINDGQLQCNWIDGDKIGVFPNSASTLQPQQVRVKVAGENSAAGASFTGNMIGWKLEQDIDYAAYYPFQNNYHLKSDNIIFSYDGQIQTGNNDKTHLGAFDYLYSAPVESDAEGRATFTMSHAGALMLFRQWTDSELTLTKMVVTAGDADIPVSLKLDLFSEQPVSSQSTAKEFTVLLDDFTVPAKSFIRVWAMMPPVDLSGKTISVKFYNEESVITYTVTGQNFVAGNAYTVANPVYALIYDAGDGTFSGGGNKYTDVKYESSGSCTFTLLTGDATPAKTGYTFRGWAEEQDGEVLEDDEITLTRTESKDVTKTLYAVYKSSTPQGDGSLPGVFSVSATKKVKFSQGNLQYQASTGTWRFAEHQYDFVGDDTYGTVYIGDTKCTNTQKLQTYSGWIDLFGWGTSGDNSKRATGDWYEPWRCGQGRASTKPYDYQYYYINNDDTASLSLTNAADWGVNMGDGKTWYTLSKEEYSYLLKTRKGSILSFIKIDDTEKSGDEGGIFGLFIFPDNFDTNSLPSTLLRELIDSYKGYSSTDKNSKGQSLYSYCTLSEFNTLQTLGVVFLPQSNVMIYNPSDYSTSNGMLFYWTSTPTGSKAYALATNLAYKMVSSYSGSNTYTRPAGMAVRLVKTAEE